MEQIGQKDKTIFNSNFRNSLLKIGRPAPKPVYNIHNNSNDLKLLTRLRLGLSHLNEHKFNHSL